MSTKRADIKNIIGTMRLAFLDMLFPPQCASCNILIGASAARSAALCDTCAGTIRPRSAYACPVCRNRIPFQPSGVSHHSACHPEAGYALVSAADYADRAVRALIQTLKYRRAKAALIPLAALLASAAAEMLPPHIFSPATAVIIPMPLHPRRERWRGFNQAELIAEKLAAGEPFTGILVEKNVLRRTKNTAPQANEKSAAARAQNVAGCFTLATTERVRGKIIFLVDDVFTSGATMGEAAKTLRAGGATSVIGIVVARA